MSGVSDNYLEKVYEDMLQFTVETLNPEKRLKSFLWIYL